MKERVKTVLLTINCLQGGGAERMVLTLGQGFYELGYEVHILRFKPLMQYEVNKNLNYHMVRFKPYKLIPGAERRDKIFARTVDKYVLKNIGQPDFTLSNLDRSDSILSSSKLNNIFYIIHNTMTLLYKLDKPEAKSNKKLKLEQIYSKHPCISVSKGVEQDFLNNFGKITPIIAIHNPIDKQEINRQATNFLPKYKNYMVHIGSFKDAKRHDLLIKAYAQTDRSMSLLLLGEGKHKGSIEELVFNLNLSDKVVFLGFQENPFPYIKHAQFKILTSDWEGCPLVIPEALALGTPVISTNCPSGPSELLPNNNLMPMGDIDAIADKMNQAMKDPLQFISSFDEDLLPIKIAKKYESFVQSLN